MIVLDDSKETLEQLWDNVEYVGTSADNPYALEKEIDVFICRGPKFGTCPTLAPGETLALIDPVAPRYRWDSRPRARILQLQ